MQVIAILAAGLLALALAASPSPTPGQDQALWPDRSRRALAETKANELAPSLHRRGASAQIAPSLSTLPDSLARPNGQAHVAIDPLRWVQTPTRFRQTYQHSFTLTNGQAPFYGKATASQLGWARVHALTLLPGEMLVQPISVAVGSTSLLVRVSGAEPGTALDLYLFDCPAEKCNLVARSTGDSGANSLTVTKPTSGLRWVLAIDGRSVPAGGMRVDYLDWTPQPVIGTLTVADSDATHPTGDSWTVTASVSTNMKPSDGFLMGFIQVRSADGTLGEAIVELHEPTR